MSDIFTIFNFLHILMSDNYNHIESSQYTIKKSIDCCGIGLNSGCSVRMFLKPAPVDSGIVFVRKDLPGSPVVAARVANVVDTTLATSIASGNVVVSTVEHLLAAFRGFGIDNVAVELESNEVPIMDGSAAPFMRLLSKCGRQRQQSSRYFIRITKKVAFKEKGKSICVEPHNGFKISGRVDFPDTLIGEQEYSFEFTYENFKNKIARARTFGFVEEVEQLWDHNRAFGANLDNVIALHWDRQSVLNESGLRFTDEFVRHKLLDIIGDLSLLGHPVLAHVSADCSGHLLHLQFMQKLLASRDCWDLVSFGNKKLSSEKERLPLFSPCKEPVSLFPAIATVMAS